MVPAPWTQPDTEPPRPPTALPVLARGVRAALVLVAVVLIGLFAVAVRIDPYGADGRPATMGTHQQLGLPPCNFVRLTGLPCPSCGMTTSFALLVRGDVLASLRANAVGTLLAVFFLGLIPWSLAGAVRGRWVWVRRLEPWVLRVVIAFTGLALLRWGIILGLTWWRRNGG